MCAQLRSYGRCRGYWRPRLWYMTGGIAVVLGKIGRNFAAGMSGGIAYLYSPNGTFEQHLFNLEMVELEDLNDQDVETLTQLVQQHFDYTKSSVAEKVLQEKDKMRKQFIKVMPTDYKKALAALAKEKEQNIA